MCPPPPNCAHRGLFASEDLGTLKKFRPYGIPTDAWLEEVRRAIQIQETAKDATKT